MKLSLSYDAAVDAWTITHENIHLKSISDIRVWEQQARVLLQQMPKGGTLLVDIHGFSLDPLMGPEWAAMLKTVVLPKVSFLLRYGPSQQPTEVAILIQGKVHDIPSGILPDRAAALAALARLRARLA